MSVDRSKKACLRCVVQLTLDKLEWRSTGGASVHLKGMPVFLRACILGQLQHSKLHTPVFPLNLNQKFIFDRTLTNCRDPSLFKEVIRGEHVKIEMIQVTEDCHGGKIIGRYDTPAHDFLFPSNELSSGELRKVPLEKSRKYQYPPDLYLSSSTLLMEATVQSPLRLLVPRSRSSSANTSSSSSSDSCHRSPNKLHPPPCPVSVPPHDKKYSSSRYKHSKASRKLFESKPDKHTSGPAVKESLKCTHTSLNSTQHRLDSILSKYHAPEGNDRHSQPATRLRARDEEDEQRESRGRRSGREGRDHAKKITFKNPVSRAKHSSEPPPSSRLRDLSPCHITKGRRKGPHEWTDCPNRSPDRLFTSPEPGPQNRTPDRFQSHSAPHSPVPSLRLPSSPYHQKCVTVPHQFLHEDLAAARATDRSLTTPRNTDSRPPFVVRRLDESLMEKRNFCGVVNGDIPTSNLGTKSSALRGTSCGAREEISSQDESSPAVSPMPNRHGSYLHRDQQVQTDLMSYSPISSISSSPSSSLSDIPVKLRLEPPIPPTSKEDLVSKYLTKTKGNMKPRPLVSQASSATAICDRLKKLREQCCECLHSLESLGEDSLTEDLQRLRDSLQEEREDALDRSARLIPDQSVLVKLGPRDYWSKRMAEFTGKRHRVLFDETLEKIYNRLYTKASLAT